jgi:hypothetical protein
MKSDATKTQKTACCCGMSTCQTEKDLESSHCEHQDPVGGCCDDEAKCAEKPSDGRK